MDSIPTLKFHLSWGTLPLCRGREERNFLLQRREEAPCNDEQPGGDGILIPDMIRLCSICGQVQEKKYGFGSGGNGVMIVLNAPRLLGRDERDSYKRDSLDLMKKIIESVKLDYRECYITNMVKCETEDMLLKPSHVFESCRGILCSEIEKFSPKIVLVMGDLMPLQKLVLDYPGISWFNIHHPITLIKNSELKKSAWNTMKLVMKKIEG